jgi:hypothetical protein
VWLHRVAPARGVLDGYRVPATLPLYALYALYALADPHPRTPTTMAG